MNWRLMVLLLLSCTPARQAYLDDLTRLETAVALGRNDEAIEIADNMLVRYDRQSDRCPVYTERARALAADGHLREALDSFARARRACESNPDASARALFEMARMIMDKADETLALPYLRRVVTSFKDTPAAKRAVVYIKDVVRRRSGPSAVVDELRALYRHVGKSSVSPFLLYEAGGELLRMGKVHEALMCFDLIMKKYPNSGLYDDAGVQAGELALRLNRPWDAARYFTLVLRTRESSILFGNYETEAMVRAQLGLADAVYAATKDPDRAIELYSDFLEQHPKGELAARASFRCYEVLRDAGRDSLARGWLERVIAGFPRSEYATRARELLNQQ